LIEGDKAMEKWEYLTLRFDEHDKWKDSFGRNGKLDKNDYDQGYKSLADLLNGLGAERWELIINNPYSMGSGFGTLVFKRPKAGS
jgi:hypothetical protein